MRSPTARRAAATLTRAAVALAFALVLAAAGCGTKDFIKGNPDLERVTADWSREEKSDMNHVLATLSAEDRERTIRDLVESERKRITVESVFAKLHVAKDAKALTVKPLRETPDPLTAPELNRLTNMALLGELEVVQAGTVGKGPTIRVVVVMRKQIPVPVEFALPKEGALMLVQMDDAWVTEPRTYDASERTIRIAPSANGNRTTIDYDIGNGRSGSDAFTW